jgi:hypothetical protein
MKYAVELVSGGMIYIYIYIYTKFHYDRFRYLSRIAVITSTTRETAMLVLLMGWMYEVCRSDWLKWHDKHTKFH